jgi:hypothetical protein
MILGTVAAGIIVDLGSNKDRTPNIQPTNTRSSYEPSTSTQSRPTLRDLEGTYSATINGITMTLRIWDADDVTAEGSLYSTNSGTRRCAVASLGSNLLTLVFLDFSELRVSYTGTSSVTLQGLVLYRQ